MSESFSFRLAADLQSLIGTLRQYNQGIVFGDYSSARHVLPIARKDAAETAALMATDGAEAISLDLYVAAGDQIGVTYSYRYGDVTFEGSLVPRAKL